jgi:hypothetical protein
LYFQVIHSAIPLKTALPSQIEQAGCIPSGELVIETMTQGVVQRGKSSELLVA